MSAFTQITIIDYGAGNLRSIVGAFSAININCSVERDVNRIRDSEILVLPGVGSFGSAMTALNESGIADALRESMMAGAKVLGVCLGMQLLGMWSDEEGGGPGLSLVRGTSRRFVRPETVELRIPHMGYNTVIAPQDSILFNGIPSQSDFYFAHSYRMEVEEYLSSDAVALTRYGGFFVSAFEVNSSIFGVQFHPELSQGNGLQLLRNFAGHALC